jgi:hypothetical protein
MGGERHTHGIDPVALISDPAGKPVSIVHHDDTGNGCDLGGIIHRDVADLADDDQPLRLGVAGLAGDAVRQRRKHQQNRECHRHRQHGEQCSRLVAAVHREDEAEIAHAHASGSSANLPSTRNSVRLARAAA